MGKTKGHFISKSPIQFRTPSFSQHMSVCCSSTGTIESCEYSCDGTGLTKTQIKWTEAKDRVEVKLTDWIYFPERRRRRAGRLEQVTSLPSLLLFHLWRARGAPHPALAYFYQSRVQVRCEFWTARSSYLALGSGCECCRDLPLVYSQNETELHVLLKEGWRGQLQPNYYLEGFHCHRHASPRGCHHQRCDRRCFWRTHLSFLFYLSFRVFPLSSLSVFMKAHPLCGGKQQRQ